MKYLIDTHILIWFLEGNKQLLPKYQAIIANTTNNISVSIVSLWEITIKMSIQKLQLSQTLPNIIKQVKKDGIEIMPIDTSHLLKILSLPFYHNDPFDRLLISQSIAENLILLTDDGKFEAYKSESLVLG